MWMQRPNLLRMISLSVLTLISTILLANPLSFANQPSNEAPPTPTPQGAPPPSTPQGAPSPQPAEQTPAELGLERYRGLVSAARAKVVLMPANLPVKFPLGINHPIRISDVAANAAGPQWEAVGFVTLSGQPQPITPADLLEMFDRHLTTLRGESASPVRASMPAPATPQAAPSDRRASPPQPGTVAVIDLIVRNVQNNQIYLLPRVRVVSLLRDALNGALNNQLRENEAAVGVPPPSQIQPERPNTI